jgi:hypothetical protein
MQLIGHRTGSLSTWNIRISDLPEHHFSAANISTIDDSKKTTN